MAARVAHAVFRSPSKRQPAKRLLACFVTAVVRIEGHGLTFLLGDRTTEMHVAELLIQELF
jgi:hypothetical protein